MDDKQMSRLKKVKAGLDADKIASANIKTVHIDIPHRLVGNRTQGMALPV